MSFLRPYALLAGIPLILAALAFLVWAYRRRRQMLALLGDQVLVNQLCANTNWWGRRWQAGLWLLALIMLVLAWARPAWGALTTSFSNEGLQIIAVLDVSESMLAQDVRPDRLTVAKQALTEVISQLDGDEIGLVLFSGASFMQVPLTTDYAMAINYLNNAGPQAISRPGTVIGRAIGTALRGFDFDVPSQKVLILITDGEDRESDPITSARVAAENDVIIYTIGVGSTDGSKIPQQDEAGDFVGYKTDNQGNEVLSALNEATLQEIADVSGGRYFRPVASDMKEMLQEISTLQKAPLQNQSQTEREDRYQYFLALALLAFVASELIPERISPKKRKSLLVQTLQRSQATEFEHAP